ncbi:MAG: PEGA domain-containing protein [Chloroflexota bacterium]|nr:PEGA domain-containing protein [Chloroflexota bacterium]
MKNLFKLMLLLVAGLLAAHAASAQSQSTATLRIKTDTAGVEIWLNGESVGHTPLTLRELPAGKHRISLLKDGYEDRLEEVAVSPAKSNSLFVVMKPRSIKLPELPVTFKVIHQHLAGSCVGTLTVSADALDYKAENDTDEFHIPVATLKSVARSVGPFLTRRAAKQEFKSPSAEGLAFRVEAPGRAYTFVAFKDTRKDENEVLGEKTRELYDVVYRLWTAALTTSHESKK